MSTKKKFFFLSFFLQVGLLFSANPPTPSAWIGGNSGTWSSGVTTVWSTGIVPNAQGAIAVLSNGPPLPVNPNITLSTMITVGMMNFDLDTGYQISSGGGYFLFNSSSSTVQINVTSMIGNGAHSIAPNITLNQPLVVAQGSTGAFTISGSISESGGAQSLTLGGIGTLVLTNGSNSYSGGTILNSGTLNVNSDSALGALTGNVTINGATLQWSNPGVLTSNRNFILSGAAVINTSGSDVTLASPGIISGSGSLEKVGSAKLILGGANSYQGGTTISAGILSISSDSNLGVASGAINIGSAMLLTTMPINSARSGTFTGTSVIDTGGQSDLLSGVFSGAGSLTVQGGGTLTLTGANTYAGGTIIATNTTLVGNTGSLPGNVTLNTSTSQLTFNQTTNGTYSGTFSSTVAGAGALTKTGTGTLTLTANNASFTGTTNVVQGKLLVDGSLASSAVTLSAGAILSGSGTVGTTISNSGIINPGDHGPTDPLTINGNLTLNGTSTVNINISPLSSDVLVVTGTASLTGANLVVTPAPGFYGLNACYTIVTTAGLGGTSFNNPPISTSSNFIPTTSYSSTNVTLCVKVLKPFFQFPFSNFNTQSVGNDIDVLNTTNSLSPDFSAILNNLVGQSFASINSALDQMHPALFSAFSELQTEVGAQIVSLFHRKPLPPRDYDNPSRIWVKPFAHELTEKKHGEQFGFHAISGGLALGFDGTVRDNLIVGVGAAWNNGHLEWHDHHGNGEVNGVYGVIYSDYQVGNFYVGGSVLGGMDFYDTDRHLDFFSVDRHAKGSFHSIDIMTQVASAYFFGSPTAYFYPYANVDLFYLHTSPFNETGASSLNLRVQGRTATTIRSEMGLALQVADANAAETMFISPLFSIGWVNLFCPVDQETYRSAFTGTSAFFETRGWNETWNLLALDFGLNITYYNFSIGFEYNVEVSPDEHSLLFNQYGDIRLDWKW